MLINPFDIRRKENKVYSDKNNIKNIDINNIIKYLSSNYSKYLKTENKDFFADKIKEYIYLKYLIDKDVDCEEIVKKILNKIFGYGILQKYIENKEVTDIRAVQFDSIFIKKKGKWIKIKEKFNSKEEFREYIKYCVLKNNKVINFEEPLVILSDKEYRLRIEAGISPVNSLNDSLVIRIHRNNKLDLNILLSKYKMLDSKSYKIIYKIIRSYSNVIIVGKGGSGKTTLLKAILEEIPGNIPISVSEETNELFIENKNIIQREIVLDRQKNNIGLDKLLKHSLVTSNDILVVGELKGEETYTFIDAINTGHMGIATLHSNSIYSAIDRLILLFKRNIKAEEYSESFIKEILYKNINYIIFMQDYKIKSIGKVQNIKKSFNIKEIYNIIGEEYD